MKLAKTVKNKKGFTLVEIIVVLVILAILASFMIPSMTRYIDDAKDQTHYATVRSVYIAAQYYVNKQYATSAVPAGTYETGDAEVDAIVEYCDSVKANDEVTVTVANNSVSEVTYTPDGGKTYSLTPNGAITVTP